MADMVKRLSHGLNFDPLQNLSARRDAERGLAKSHSCQWMLRLLVSN